MKTGIYGFSYIFPIPIFLKNLLRFLIEPLPKPAGFLQIRIANHSGSRLEGTGNFLQNPEIPLVVDAL